jgi:crotonobetainyl-CoA:carnitine CoA-transferase CaiB-like acyl-CoA transferase
MKKYISSTVFVVALAISAYAQTADQHFKAGLESYDKKAYDQLIQSESGFVSPR